MRSAFRKLYTSANASIGQQALNEPLAKLFTVSALTEARYPPSGAPKQLDPANESQAPKPDLVEKMLGTNVMSNAEQLKTRLRQLQKDFQRFEGDTGSTEVQVALLSAQIQNLSKHMQTHRKDYATRRGLEGMLNKRRKLMQYFRRKDFEAYSILLVRLGLKDSFVKLDRFMLQHQESLEYKMKKNRKR